MDFTYKPSTASFLVTLLIFIPIEPPRQRSISIANGFPTTMGSMGTLHEASATIVPYTIFGDGERLCAAATHRHTTPAAAIEDGSKNMMFTVLSLQILGSVLEIIG